MVLKVSPRQSLHARQSIAVAQPLQYSLLFLSPSCSSSPSLCCLLDLYSSSSPILCSSSPLPPVLPHPSPSL
uniref:Uncharacterized protein n=1 Tax=Oryza brachyantha TaxID=4533 RepID=J3N285_ORYBR